MPRVRRTKSLGDLDRQYSRIAEGLVNQYNRERASTGGVSNQRRQQLINRRKRINEVYSRYSRNMTGRNVYARGDLGIHREDGFDTNTQYSRNRYMGISRGSVAK